MSARVSQKIEAMQNCISSLTNFQPTDCIFSGNGRSGLALDENRLLICTLAVDNQYNVFHRIRSIMEILAVEIIVGGKSESEVRSKQIGNAVVGGVLFGPVGALIGSETAKNKHASQITKFLLRLKLNDTQSPFHEVVVFPAKQWPRELERIEKDLRSWQAKIEILKERARNGSPVQTNPSYGAPANNPSVAGMASSVPSLVQVKPSRYIPACTLRSVLAPHSYPIRVNQATFTIGRSQINDLILQDSTVSRQHALLRYAGDGWVIQDQNSTSGLIVNGKRVRERRLVNGDQIKIGQAVFIFNTK